MDEIEDQNPHCAVPAMPPIEDELPVAPTRRLTLEIDMTGSQFDTATLWEAARVIETEVTPQIESGRAHGVVHDRGNWPIGSWSVNGTLPVVDRLPCVPGTNVPYVRTSERGQPVGADPRLERVDMELEKILDPYRGLLPRQRRKAFSLREQFRKAGHISA